MSEREDDEGRGGTPPPTRRQDEPTVFRVQRRANGRQRDAREPEPRLPDVRLSDPVQGRTPSSLRRPIIRPSQRKLRQTGEEQYELTRVGSEPVTRFGRLWADVRHWALGETLASSQLRHERLTKLKALAIFSSDNLSSSAYATEEILLILILAGTAALTNAIPIAVAIAILAAVVATSYTQLVRAYPGGGGAYAVTLQNFGPKASFLAGSTLIVDYILTVAVSTAAGVAAITSALPELSDMKVEIALASVVVLTIGNLRGIREAGTIFALPPYFFILSFGGMIVVGLVRLLLGHDLRAGTPPDVVEEGTQALTLFIVLRAFASGSAALTGIEAIADGTPSFKPPEAKNASITLAWMASILAAFFLGTTFLAIELDAVPSESRTVIAQIALTVYGDHVLFYLVQAATAMILLLAANTAFAGLPTLTSVMARDGAMPKQFAFRGDRLAFSNGILVLGLASATVLVAFGADTHKIIPLYAFGVFMAFTLSQAGMVVHWRRTQEPGWRLSLILNLVGCIVTGVVAVIIGATKFMDGAWLSMAIMGGLVLFIWRIRAHYLDASRQLGEGLTGAEPVAEEFYIASTGRPQAVVVPVEGIDRAVIQTVAYARVLSPNVTALHVTDNADAAEELRRAWEESIPDVPLVVVESPYRSLIEPVLAYVEALDRTQPNQIVTVVLPEFVPRHFWQRFLHNQQSLRLKRALSNRPHTVVVELPYRLR